MDYDFNEIRQNIKQQVPWTRDIVDSLLLQVLNKLDIARVRKIEEVYLVGCGDSRIAGTAMVHAFPRFAGLPARAFAAISSGVPCPNRQ